MELFFERLPEEEQKKILKERLDEIDLK